MSGYSESDKSEDVKVLHSMGYAQELERRMSQFSNFAVSFSIICILSGGINSLAQATSGAGGAAIGIGWPLGCFVSLVFAVAMAQISSAYPTAGGLYHWGSILGNTFTGWLTAWFNLLGLVTVLGAINVGTYYFFMGAFGTPYFGLEDSTTVRIIFLAIITGLQALVNHMGIGLTAKLTDFSGYLIFATSILLALVCLLRPTAIEIGRLFTFANYSGEAGGKCLAGQFLDMGFPARPAFADLHDHRLRCLGAHIGGNAEGGAFRAARHDRLGAVVGAVRLHHAVLLRADAAEYG